MPQYVIKLSDRGKDYYLMWSTIVDAPITPGMSLDEFKAWYRDEYGRLSFEYELPERLKRVEERGTSCRDQTLDEVISCNRAGDNESELTKEQIIEAYIRRRNE